MLSRKTPDVEAWRSEALVSLERLTSTDWQEPERPPVDWKKFVLIVGLGALSWVATFIGMLELIEANLGALSLATKFVIGFSVAMLMMMIIWLLDQLFAPLPLSVKVFYVAGYLFLTSISVGFGFGFYWKVFESRSEASRSAQGAVTQIQGSLVAASTRLDQLTRTLDDLTAVSAAKAIEERERGTSCPNSRPGDGPRRKLRDDDAARFGFASSFVKGRSEQVKTDLKSLDSDLLRITSSDPSTFGADNTRNAFLKDLERKLELSAAQFNAFRTDPQLRQIRSDLATRADQTLFSTGRGDATFSCPDPQLQIALRGVVSAIDQLPDLQKPAIATVEGSEAVVEAFRRLAATAYGALSFNLPPSADDMRELRKRAVRQAENTGGQADVPAGMQGGLSQRDYIPLAIAVFVDLCLLLVSLGRPMNRLSGLVPKMRNAERGPVYQILSKFSDIHRDAEVREKFEVFRHVVFDYNGDYYVAVPLDAPTGEPSAVRLSLQQEAHLLANLFASFEKEKIFSRVINPLLGTRTIQAKLRRQGSKFARAQAFRVYRFRDGAWSEIILGAVMGAAKRAEAERLRRQLMEGPRLETPLATGPTFAPDLPDTAASPVAMAVGGGLSMSAGDGDSEAATNRSAGRRARRAARQPRCFATEHGGLAKPDADLVGKFGPHAHSAARDMAFDDRHDGFSSEDHVGRQDEEPDAGEEASGRFQRKSSRSESLPERIRRIQSLRPTSGPTEPEADVEVRAVPATGRARSETDDGEIDPLDNIIDIASLRRTHFQVIEGEPRTPDRPDAPLAARDATPNTPAETPHVTVRFTERSADFIMPASAAQTPGMVFERARALETLQLNPSRMPAETDDQSRLIDANGTVSKPPAASPPTPPPLPTARQLQSDATGQEPTRPEAGPPDRHMAPTCAPLSDEDLDALATRFAPRRPRPDHEA
ncbi:MAG: hypothetical protein ACFCUN_02915 [Hyphomicrobiaceae bacterium]